ncbi:MAG: helix-turn-helix domain-containing protein [Oscillospiraceae bacterium]|jgi:transcriptional regulator with XRE-family HTH domain|nr:helix-turn-helix domain-containing protein [Oscillospiraceae bacterium]
MKQKSEVPQEFRERLRTLRREAGYTLQTLADKLNAEYGASINKGMLSKYENGLNMPTAGTLYCLRLLLSVPKDYLLGKSNEKYVSERLGSGEYISVSVPVYTTKSGTNHPDESVVELLPKSMLAGGREFFGLKITGNRLAPRFANGDVIIFERRRKASKNSVCAVSIGRAAAILCTVINKREGKQIIPLDPALEPSFYSTAQIKELPVHIQGEAISLRRRNV